MKMQRETPPKPAALDFTKSHDVTTHVTISNRTLIMMYRQSSWADKWQVKYHVDYKINRGNCMQTIAVIIIPTPWENNVRIAEGKRSSD